MRPRSHGESGLADDSQATHAGHLTVSATGQTAAATGLAAKGDRNQLNNTGHIVVTATGATTDATGVAASGGGETAVVNTGIVEARADHHVAGAYLETVDLPGQDEGAIVLKNWGDIRAQAMSDAGRAAGVVLGGPVALGTEQEEHRPGTISLHNYSGATIGGYAVDGNPTVAITVEDYANTYRRILIDNACRGFRRLATGWPSRAPMMPTYGWKATPRATCGETWVFAYSHGPWRPRAAG